MYLGDVPNYVGQCPLSSRRTLPFQQYLRIVGAFKRIRVHTACVERYFLRKLGIQCASWPVPDNLGGTAV